MKRLPRTLMKLFWILTCLPYIEATLRTMERLYNAQCEQYFNSPKNINYKQMPI